MTEVDLRCYYHPEREATSQCDRCGDYLCADCVQEHDELHVCGRCFEDIRPREEMGMSAKIACVLSAEACSFWLVALLDCLPPLSVLPFSERRTLWVISIIMSALAVLLACTDMRGRASGELLFRWSVVISASSSALVMALPFLANRIPSATVLMLISSGSLVILLISVMLLGASFWKKARPVWALVVALLAPLMFGAAMLHDLFEG